MAPRPANLRGLLHWTLVIVLPRFRLYGLGVQLCVAQILRPGAVVG